MSNTCYIYADNLTLLTHEPRDMQFMLSRLPVYTKNKHLICDTSNFEVVHLNSAGKNVPVLLLAPSSQRIFLVSGHGFLQDLERG